MVMSVKQDVVLESEMFEYRFFFFTEHTFVGMKECGVELVLSRSCILCVLSKCDEGSSKKCFAMNCCDRYVLCTTSVTCSPPLHIVCVYVL